MTVLAKDIPISASAAEKVSVSPRTELSTSSLEAQSRPSTILIICAAGDRALIPIIKNPSFVA